MRVTSAARLPASIEALQHARSSPDGRWIAYTSTESGRYEVYVIPFPGPGPKTLVSTAGGDWARWRRDGAELFYQDLNGMLMAAEVDSQGAVGTTCLPTVNGFS